MNTQPLPGTSEPGWVEPRFVSLPSRHAQPEGVRALMAWKMGDCQVVRFRDSDGLHMAISCDQRMPTWDEIKTARYRLLPDDATFALLLPPRAEYIDHPLRPNVVELTEINP